MCETKRNKNRTHRNAWKTKRSRKMYIRWWERKLIIAFEMRLISFSTFVKQPTEKLKVFVIASALLDASFLLLLWFTTNCDCKHCCASFEKDTLQLMRVPLDAFYALKYKIDKVKRCSSCGWTALSERRRKICSSVGQCSCSPGTNKYSRMKERREKKKNEIETSNLSNPSNRHL